MKIGQIALRELAYFYVDRKLLILGINARQCAIIFKSTLGGGNRLVLILVIGGILELDSFRLIALLHFGSRHEG